MYTSATWPFARGLRGCVTLKGRHPVEKSLVPGSQVLGHFRQFWGQDSFQKAREGPRDLFPACTCLLHIFLR